MLNNLFEMILQLGREVLDEAAKVVKVGVTADEIDRVVHQVGFESKFNQHYFIPTAICSTFYNYPALSLGLH